MDRPPSFYYREIAVRLVGAECAGPEASRQDIGERDIILRDSFQYRLDGLADALPGAFGSRHRPPIASSEPDRARKFFRQRIDLLLRLLGALDVPPLLGFFEFFMQIGKPPSVGGLGLLIEHLAGVTQTADMDSGLCEILTSAR